MTEWLIALDIDGTVLREDGGMNDAVIGAVARVRDAGHEVMLATGRSVAMTLPILDRLGITPQYVVCSNGAITLRRDPEAPTGYSREFVETFDPTAVLTTIRGSLESANYAVEDEQGMYRYTGYFPDGTLGAVSEQVEFEDLLVARATRVVVISPGHAIEDFLSVVERMGLHKVSYNVGWTAWLDIAPDGVNKATALERVRELLNVPRSRVLAVGDGRNDIDMLAWAAAEGRGVAMGQAPDEVRAVANEVTATDLDDGVALVLDTL
ncbi:HAD-IIB family hydrolase [Leifsonia sp. H3M29-4]|uniref:HAD family hydrolase n=1 Tax=Salinibacterium metalliresistens TaxID=3031321 RepID=UPI0023DB4617|nr:HAD-IIB family hydrolase [Salinibacterium metalliresistens]MDF1477889.1 HAD-IIB family hydrolase [Salinibacterium metalliresistens]